MSQAIEVEQILPTGPGRVWRAITEPAQMQQWFFSEIQKFEPAVGSRCEFTVQLADRAYVHVWQVTEVIPQQLLRYTWEYAGILGTSTVLWLLTALAPDQTRLVLSHSGTESFPADDPVFGYQQGFDGWRYLIQTNLADFLANETDLA
ncbi:MAG: SRPBCC domain-containing protein [Pseudomonadota bacterium]